MSGDELSAILYARYATLTGEGLDAGLRAPEDQRVDIVRAFVGIDHLQVDDVADDAERAPGDAVARRIEAGERALEAAHFCKRVLLRAEHVVHHDLARDGGAQAHLAVDFRCG